MVFICTIFLNIKIIYKWYSNTILFMYGAYEYDLLYKQDTRLTVLQLKYVKVPLKSLIFYINFYIYRVAHRPKTYSIYRYKYIRCIMQFIKLIPNISRCYAANIFRKRTIHKSRLYCNIQNIPKKNKKKRKRINGEKK